MTTPDWAEQEAANFLKLSPDPNRKQLAKRFREIDTDAESRGRIAGLREAAEILKRGPDGDRAGEGIAILAAADKLEKGEA